MVSAGESPGEGNLYSNCTQVAVTYVKRALHHGFPRKTVDRESVIENGNKGGPQAHGYSRCLSPYICLVGVKVAWSGSGDFGSNPELSTVMW